MLSSVTQMELRKIVGTIEAEHFTGCIAIDGRGGTGKTNVAHFLASALGADLLHVDDYNTGGTCDYWNATSPDVSMRTSKNWEQIRRELELLKKSSELTIVEGVYTSILLSGLVDQSLLLLSDEEVRRNRLVEKNGGLYHDEWFNIWDREADYVYSTYSSLSDFKWIVLNGGDRFI